MLVPLTGGLFVLEPEGRGEPVLERIGPATITDAAVSSDDLALDVWVSPQGEATVLDEDEFAALPLPPADRTAARAALAQLLALAGRGELPA